MPLKPIARQFNSRSILEKCNNEPNVYEPRSLRFLFLGFAKGSTKRDVRVGVYDNLGKTP